jgi:hypothetical protein
MDRSNLFGTLSKSFDMMLSALDDLSELTVTPIERPEDNANQPQYIKTAWGTGHTC